MEKSLFATLYSSSLYFNSFQYMDLWDANTIAMPKNAYTQTILSF